LIPSLLIIAVALLGQAFFSLLETGLETGRKTWLRAKAEEKGGKKYAHALEIAENPDTYAASLCTCCVFLRILAGVVGGSALLGLLPSAVVFVFWEQALAAVFAAAAIALVGGFLSGVLARQIALSAPEEIIAQTSAFIRAVAFLCHPVVSLGGILSNFARKISRLEKDEESPQRVTEAELRLALQEGEKSGVVEKTERTMVEGVFYLGDRPAAAFMTHRSEIAWLDSTESLDGIKKAISASRKQRYFPVADGNLDGVIGVASVDDILFAAAFGQWTDLKSVMKPPRFVPETMSALKVFESFKQGDVDFLLVMDEYGGFAGVLSLNDLVEEIVGQLSAHTDEAEAVVKQPDGAYLVDAGVNIDEIAELLSIPSLVDEHQDYHTLAGFILSLAGEIPRTGESFDYKGFSFTIVDMDANRIDKVMIKTAL
jgi:putative hemolysin